jgi:uncharacterized protein (DUF433 family)
MALEIELEPVPLAGDEDGVVRVAGTRVTLDSVVSAFEQGATAEEIAQQYPSLRLADVYAVIGFYLRQRPSVEVYLRDRQRQAASARAQNQARLNSGGIRERLLARRDAAGSA